MSSETKHLIKVGIRVMEIGPLSLHGRSHDVTPIELGPEKLVFLCSWDIPMSPKIKLRYEIDDMFDHIQVYGRIQTQEPLQDYRLYQVQICTDRDQKARITGMLNRMISSHVAFSHAVYQNYIYRSPGQYNKKLIIQ
ncbi:hypothetical protein [Paenibacillus sp. HGF5]|uniref:hypothetical protein n=1 Tax=Paenibacillus sp. HGF5 TaxID=908341 RepID=UPI0002072FF3|nr:hypothetical protein [Paenibacillus sp. HGF5]EGG37545.1 hypothetical protein HMPREF9412_2051 [Paenibacillus sp. HGF5]